MIYIVDCRKINNDGEIEGVQFRGFGVGLPDKKTANTVFNREVNSGMWDAICMEKLYSNNISIDIKSWYRESVDCE